MQIYDRWLVHKAVQGDKAAFGILYDRHAGRVFNLLRRLVSDISTAEDLTQETFLTAWSTLDRWQGRGSFSTWLCGIAVNHHRNAQRRLRDHSVLEETLAEPMPNGDPLACLTGRESVKAIEQAIADLPPDCRDAFVLVRIEELAYREAAELLQIPLGTLQSRLARANRLLQVALTTSIHCERSGPCPTVTTKTR